MTTTNEPAETPALASAPDEGWRVLLLINDWIKHADAKIAGTLAAAGVSAGVLYNVAQGVKSPPLQTTVGIITTSVMLLFTVVFAGLALRPRLWTRAPAISKIYFEHIARAYPKSSFCHKSRDKSNAFVVEFTSTISGSDRMAREVAAQVWALAHVAAAKYRWINLAIVFSFISMLSLAITAFFVLRYS